MTAFNLLNAIFQFKKFTQPFSAAKIYANVCVLNINRLHKLIFACFFDFFRISGRLRMIIWIK